jgi:hypothetical protein
MLLQQVKENEFNVCLLSMWSCQSNRQVRAGQKRRRVTVALVRAFLTSQTWISIRRLNPLTEYESYGACGQGWIFK